MKPLQCFITNLVDVFMKMGQSSHEESVYMHIHTYAPVQAKVVLACWPEKQVGWRMGK